MVGGIVGVAIGVVLASAYLVPLLRGALRRSPAGVVKRLPSPGAEHHVRLTWLTATGGTWNPQKRLGVANPIFERGHGTYRLGPDGEVELTWRAADGTARRFRGPIPDGLRADSPERRRVRHALHLIAALYAVVTVVGFTLGFLVGRGSVVARTGYGGLGVMVGWVLIWFVVMVVNVGRGTRSAIGRSAPEADRRGQ